MRDAMLSGCEMCDELTRLALALLAMALTYFCAAAAARAKDGE